MPRGGSRHHRTNAGRGVGVFRFRRFDDGGSRPALRLCWLHPSPRIASPVGQVLTRLTRFGIIFGARLIRGRNTSNSATPVVAFNYVH